MAGQSTEMQQPGPGFNMMEAKKLTTKRNKVNTH